jgi:hypothetical protein
VENLYEHQHSFPLAQYCTISELVFQQSMSVVTHMSLTKIKIYQKS